MGRVWNSAIWWRSVQQQLLPLELLCLPGPSRSAARPEPSPLPHRYRWGRTCTTTGSARGIAGFFYLLFMQIHLGASKPAGVLGLWCRAEPEPRNGLNQQQVGWGGQREGCSASPGTLGSPSAAPQGKSGPASPSSDFSRTVSPSATWHQGAPRSLQPGLRSHPALLGATHRLVRAGGAQWARRACSEQGLVATEWLLAAPGQAKVLHRRQPNQPWVTTCAGPV